MSASSIERRAKADVNGLTALLGVLTAFAPFATDMYLVAFPVMAADLHTDAGGVQLTLSVFFLGMGLGQLVYGPLIDRFGRRGPLLAGIALYTLTSFLLLFVETLPAFVTLRFFQAVGGCAGMVVSRAIIRDCCDVVGAAQTFSALMAVQAVGPVAAPVIGGFILAVAHWHAIFIGLGALGGICFIWTFLALPETLPATNRVRNSLMESLRVFGRTLARRNFIAPALCGGLGGASIFAFISGSSCMG